jgi:hypothetical protein
MARKRKNKKESPQAVVGLGGMYRVNIVDPDGLTPAYFALGSGNTSLATNATSLPGEIAGSQMVTLGANSALTTRAASSDAGTTQYLATFSSNIFGASTTIGCAGLHATSTPGTVMCGGTFASSTVATNQAVNCTYQILFSATVTDN